MKEEDSDWLSSLKTVSSFDTALLPWIQQYVSKFNTQQFHLKSISDIMLKSAGSSSATGPGSSTVAVDESCDELQRFSPSSLLMESLIEQLCKLIEKDASKQKQLYLKICQKLHQMKLIDESYGIEEFQSLRSYYQKALYHLVTVAKASGVGRETQALLPKLNQQMQETINSPCEWSRYFAEFEELEFIARGGFGQVFKARHKLDGGVYAVKKILLRYHTANAFIKNLREVKMLARLNHPNIVAYKAAWLEPLDSQHQKQSKVTVIVSESHQTEISKMQDSSDGVVFEHSKSSSKEESTSNMAICYTNKAMHVWNCAQEETGNQGCAILYVQMQLCEETLRHWLDSRNHSSVVPLSESICLQMFKNIVQGVEYIHSQGIVHHDLKPSNIFVSEDLQQIQVGDFGLACSIFSCSTHVPVSVASGHHHGDQIGTKLYAAPEQLKGVCTFKSDIFSLGIVLLELIQPFQTDMERYKVIGQLRAGHVPTDLPASYPRLAHIISQTVCSSPNKRPTASDLLTKLELECKSINNKIIAEKDEIIKKLHWEAVKREKEIEELRQQLSNLKQINDSM